MAQDRIGIIGPGRMGLAMLKHLKKARFNVTVYDVNEAQSMTSTKHSYVKQSILAVSGRAVREK